jgi:hypothetical protein
MVTRKLDGHRAVRASAPRAFCALAHCGHGNRKAFGIGRANVHLNVIVVAICATVATLYDA